MTDTTYKRLKLIMMACIILVALFVDRFPAWRVLFIALAGLAAGCAVCLLLFPVKRAVDASESLDGGIPVGVSIRAEYHPTTPPRLVGYHVMDANGNSLCVLPDWIKFPSNPT